MVQIRNDAEGMWLQDSIRYSVPHPKSAAAGAEAVLAKLSEVLFVETLRRYIALPACGTRKWEGRSRCCTGIPPGRGQPPMGYLMHWRLQLGAECSAPAPGAWRKSRPGRL